jgi:transcriptional regulator with XRE-family HTH domain
MLVNNSQENEWTALGEEKQPSTNLISRQGLIERLRRGPEARARFVESRLTKDLAFQIRSLRDREEWSQTELAEKVGMNQNAISRLENPFYGKATLTTLKRIAAIFDVGLVVRFEPFSQLVNWVSGTPYEERGLSPDTMDIPSFAQEFEIANVPLESPERIPVQSSHRIPEGAASQAAAPPSREASGLALGGAA